ncbi:nucleotide-binding universal stress UspA family protein [Limimaricola variabilis]|uniref:Nucleotide-binding universal stress UspA family protein n=1 Tax=Limimaricola variabilis TaxID=1492771 RepID=A0ABR6HMM3_9RHOB|nr:universal stress protein [Limimaricola variabilis]MBB3711795.1 nucleotide-binding universal stress UspA family protein [Limimaricola variabilis]
MTCRTIALCFTDTASAPTLARAGAALARHHGAHLLGLHVLPDPVVHASISMYVTGEILNQIRARQRDTALEIETAFKKAAEAEGATPEWRCLEARLATIGERLCESARAADLVLVMRPERDAAGRPQEELIRNAGRPVLMIPQGYQPAALGASAVIGWSATREATRAAHDAVLLLDKGAEVVLLSVEQAPDPGEQDYPANEMAAMFSRHEMNATVTHRSPGGSRIAEVIEREAFETGASFIATGAFGHSKAYDFVLGTVTRDLMQRAKRPVLFSK